MDHMFPSALSQATEWIHRKPILGLYMSFSNGAYMFRVIVLRKKEGFAWFKEHIDGAAASCRPEYRSKSTRSLSPGSALETCAMVAEGYPCVSPFSPSWRGVWWPNAHSSHQAISSISDVDCISKKKVTTRFRQHFSIVPSSNAGDLWPNLTFSWCSPIAATVSGRSRNSGNCDFLDAHRNGHIRHI